jgi:hypothetical protein
LFLGIKKDKKRRRTMKLFSFTGGNREGGGRGKGGKG